MSLCVCVIVVAFALSALSRLHSMCKSALSVHKPPRRKQSKCNFVYDTRDPEMINSK